MRRIIRALAWATVLAVIVVAAWSWTASVTMPGPPPAHALSFWQHPTPASYLALASAPTGNGGALFGVLAVIYMLALIIAGIRNRDARRDAAWRRLLDAQQTHDQDEEQPVGEEVP